MYVFDLPVKSHRSDDVEANPVSTESDPDNVLVRQIKVTRTGIQGW